MLQAKRLVITIFCLAAVFAALRWPQHSAPISFIMAAVFAADLVVDLVRSRRSRRG